MPVNADRPTDEALMLELRSATERAVADALFNQVFERYHGRVVSWCYRITRSRDTAHDLGQEVFLKAWRHRDSFRGDSRVSTWLYAITRNHCLTAMKKHRNDPVQIENAMHNSLRDLAAVDPDRAAERRELSERLLQLMVRTLDPLEARVMTLHYGHDIPLATITRELALDNPSGAKAYIVNARRKLQGILRRRGFQVVMAARAAAGRDCWRDEVAA
jgi:RNA polymerase sigma-70 factor (ECF subfamily)